MQASPIGNSRDRCDTTFHDLRRAALMALAAVVLSTTGGCIWYKIQPWCPPNTTEQPSLWDTTKDKAELGDVQSQYKLARFYSEGFSSPCAAGTKKIAIDHAEAYFWFDIVRLSGDPDFRKSAEFSMEAEGHYLTYPRMKALDDQAKNWHPASSPTTKTLPPGR